MHLVSRRASRLLALSIAVLSAFLVLSAAAAASDATLRLALDRWSRTIGADARSVTLAAKRHQPDTMAAGAVRFRQDALRARAAIAAERPSTPRGRRAQQLALAAFRDYVTAGSGWVASGRARIKGDTVTAKATARAAATGARRGSRLLVAAGKLLR